MTKSYDALTKYYYFVIYSNNVIHRLLAQIEYTIVDKVQWSAIADSAVYTLYIYVVIEEAATMLLL